MKKRLLGLMVLSAVFLFSCTQAPATPPVTPPVTPPSPPVQSPVAPGPIVFELTEAEQAAYDGIRSDKAQTHLEGLEPISVAKLYIQAQLDKDYETEYALYYTSKVADGEGWTLEKHLEIPESDRATKDEVYEVLVPLVDGEFIQSGNFAGYIRYKVKFHDSGEEEEWGFQLKKDPDSVWKVAFMPIQ